MNFYLTDSHIKINEPQISNNLKISSRSFEKGKEEFIDKHWVKGITGNETNLDGSVFFADIEEFKNGGLKSFEEAKEK